MAIYSCSDLTSYTTGYTLDPSFYQATTVTNMENYTLTTGDIYTPLDPRFYPATTATSTASSYFGLEDFKRATRYLTLSTPPKWEGSVGDYYIIPSKKDQLKSKLRQNLAFKGSIRGLPLYNPRDNERVAIETLREMITEEQLRKYLRYGFILVKGRSGDTYQVFRNRDHTRVWRGGRLIKEVCVTLRDKSVPPTDKVIACKTMIEVDEESYQKAANVYKMAA